MKPSSSCCAAAFSATCFREDLGGGRGGAPRDLTGLGVQSAEGEAADVAGGVVDAAPRATAEDEAHRDAVADREVDDVVDELCDTQVVFRHGGEAHAVVDRDRAAESLPQLGADVDARPLGDDDRGGHAPGVIDDAG